MKSNLEFYDGRAKKPLSTLLLKLCVLLILPVESFSNTYFPIGTGVIFAPFFVIWICESVRVNRVFISGEFFFVALMLVFFTISCFVQAVSGVVDIKSYLRLFMLLVFFIVVLDLSCNDKLVDELILFYVFGVFYLCLTAAINFIGGETWAGLTRRYSAAGVGPNNFALILSSALPMVYAIIFYSDRYFSSKFSKFFATLCVVLIFGFFVIQTASRAGFILFSFSVLVILAIYLKRSGRLWFWLALLFFAGLVFSIVDFGLNFRLDFRVFDRMTTVTDDARFGYWGEMLNFFALSPFFGIGLGGGFSLLGMEPHSLLVVYLVENGMFFFVSFVVFILVPIFRIIKSKAEIEKKVLLVTISIVVLVGASTLNWWDRSTLFFVLAVVSSFSLRLSDTSSRRPVDVK